MYCHNCKKEIDGTSKYCPHCGAEQVTGTSRKAPDQDGGGKRPWLRVVLIILVVAVALAAAAVLLGGRPEETLSTQPDPAPTTPTMARSGSVIGTIPAEEILSDGWHTEGGERFFINDGERCVGPQEIDGEAYYFDEDGVLAVNEDVDYEGIILHADADGRLNALTIPELYGSWSDESYHFGNGGTSNILELGSEVENCDKFRFCLEASGLHGAKVNGTWKIYIRHNGSWEHLQDISYTQPEGYFDLEFDEPKTFDAITAYPTVRGNASYNVFFYLQNVHLLF